MRNRIVIPGAASLVTSLSGALQKDLTDHHYKVFTQDMAGHGCSFTICKGNFLLWFFGCNRSVKLSLSYQENDLIADLKCGFIGAHITLLILLLLLFPPFHIGILILHTPPGWIFIAAHLLGLVMQIMFRKRLIRFIREYCEKNAAVPNFCPQCGKPLNIHGKCSNCSPDSANAEQ